MPAAISQLPSVPPVYMSSRMPAVISAAPMMMPTNLDMLHVPGAYREAKRNDLESLPRSCKEFTAQPHNGEGEIARSIHEDHVPALRVERRCFRHAVFSGDALSDGLDRGFPCVFLDDAISFGARVVVSAKGGGDIDAGHLLHGVACEEAAIVKPVAELRALSR